VNAPGVPVANSARWQATLELEYAAGAARTYLKHWQHTGPLLVQRAFHPEPGGICHSYLLHPPSGLVGGDQLQLRARLGAGSQVLLTTPAATKFYRSAGPTARLQQTLELADGAAGEWLPQENILFDGARAWLNTRIELHGSARFIGWEITCFGRPACAEHFGRGRADVGFELYRDGRPLLLDRLRVDGTSPAGGAALRGHAVSASLIATGADRALLERLREVDAAAVLGGVTLLGDVIVCRALAALTAPVRDWFERLWTLLRPHLLGRPACAPRIWAT